MKNAWLAVCFLFIGSTVMAQQKELYPLGDYEELTDSKPHDGKEVWERMTADTRLEWGTIDVRYPKLNVPDVKPKGLLNLKAWKGERVNAQAVIWSRIELEKASIVLSDLKCGSARIPASAVSAHFVRYVMTDELNKDGQGGCGWRGNKAEWDSTVVADVLDILPVRTVKACTTQPVWMQVNVPVDARAGKYQGTLTLQSENRAPLTLRYQVTVSNRTLPAPDEWKMHLDLWQNPYAVARYYQVPLWSRAHFDAMLPLMKKLADAGQRSITATIMHKPWAGQTEDHYDSMVFRMKRLDGTWQYDYTVFDKWVEFMMNEVGIKGTISCYTMIPWALSFDYFDQATNRVQFVKCKPGDSLYADYWGSFLKDFARHLRAKGWFEKTAISMDERPMESMREAIKVIKQADPEYKITLAGNYHEEIEGDLYYLSIPYGHRFPDEVLAKRRAEGKISTVYTCCTEAFPNIFTFSAPAEATWTAIHALAGGYDGYLRWAVNSWTADPLRDSRFRTWAAGDTYNLYPGPRSSIRFERLLEGLQDCEKIRVLREEWTAKGEKKRCEQLEKMLSRFTPEGMKTEKRSAGEMVAELEAFLNQ